MLKIDRLNASLDEVFFTYLICNKGYNYGISLFEDFRETLYKLEQLINGSAM